jgi:hypothetical protein
MDSRKGATMLLQAVLLSDDDDRRTAGRLSINQPSTLRDESRTACDVYVRDLSETGFSIAADATLALGSTVTIGLPGHGRAAARVVRRVTGGYGCEFFEPLSTQAVRLMFRGDTVIQLGSSEPIEMTLPQPDIVKLPGAVRIGVIVGSSALLWVGLVKAVVALF